MWYWDGSKWRSTTTTDGQYRWDGYEWIPLRINRYTALPHATRGTSVWLLLGLLMLDLVGFVPGVGWAAAAAAALVLLVIDGRGLVTLNGWIKWRRMSFELKLLAAVLGIALLHFVVGLYIVQRLFMLAKGAWAPKPTHRAPIAVHETAAESRIDVAPLDAGAMRPALEALVAQATNELPEELLTKLRSLVATIVDILPAHAASDLLAHDRFVVERTVDDYLPSAIKTYLKLPPAYRSMRLADADGKTADEVLSEELDLLQQRMTQVADVAHRKDVEALLVHGRFLRSKFGPSSLTLKS